MIGGILGAVVGLALWGLDLTDGWWVLWLGLAGIALERLTRWRPGSGSGDGGRVPEFSGGYDFGGRDGGCGGGD